jgi:three-Cys-motif partner protein
MAQDKFGAEHTERKLRILQRYLDSYTTALKKQPFNTIYFDAFAGTGVIPQDEQKADLLNAQNLEVFIQGSAKRALSIKNPFDQYIFVEKSSEKIRELRGLTREFPMLAARFVFQVGDANLALKNFCENTDWKKSRAVVFLDPYGNQVSWETVELIATTKAIDMWYLFPAGLGVHRQIGRDGTVHVTHEESLNRLLGTSKWRGRFLQNVVKHDLFGASEQVEKIATPRSVTEFMIERLQGPFQGRVATG